MTKLVIFDWDGTLMDSCPKIIHSVQTTAKKLNLPIPSDNAVKGIIGISLEPAIDILFPDTTGTIKKTIIQMYSDEYVHHSEVQSPLFDGAISLLNMLRDRSIHLAVATGKKRKGLERVWQQSQTKHYFASSICADEAESKPSPDMLHRLLAHFELTAKDAVFIGDTKHDLKMAKAIDMPCVGLTHGAGFREELEVHQPDFIADDLHQLHQYLHKTTDRY